MNILVLLTDNGIDISSPVYPPFLSEIDGSPLIEHVIEQILTIRNARYIFGIYQQHAKRHHLNEVIRLLVPDAKIFEIGNQTEGSVCTALLSWGYLDLEMPLIIISGNSLIKDDLNRILSDFRVRNLDGGVVVFRSIHPHFSYVKADSNYSIVEAADRRPISQNACAEFYYFRTAKIFIEAAQDMIRKDARSVGIFSMTPVYNQMLLRRMQVGYYIIDKDSYIPPPSIWGRYSSEVV